MPKHYPDGRPTVATPENVAKAWDYANGAWQEFGDAVPMAEGLADYLDISTSSLYTRQEFSDVIEVVKRKQARYVASGGLKGTFNPMISKLILSSKHGYVEKTATEAENLNKNIDVSDLSAAEVHERLKVLRSHQSA